MKKRLFFFAGVVMAASLMLAAKASRALPRLVGSPSHQTRMLVAGDRGPVVVLDSFGAMASDLWGTVQWRCAKFARVVAYDHLGTGGSDPGPLPRDARRIATELHALLQAAHLKPPYILVGYSFGGPYMRVFTGLYPEEVSAMVLVDPAQEEMFDWLKARRPDVNVPSANDEAKQNEYACTYISLDQARASPLPKCPLTLITSMRSFGEMDPRLRPQWLASHQRWLARIPGARHIVTERSDHGILWEEPDFVVNTIRETVERVSRASLGGFRHSP